MCCRGISKSLSEVHLMIKLLLLLSRTLCDGKKSVSELLDAIDAQIEAGGLERVAERGFGDRARPRRYEIVAALNRMRSLRMN